MAIKFLNDQLFPTDVFLVDVSAGRVGINTLLPRTALEVVGTLRVWSGLNTHTYVETSSASNLGSIQGKKNSDDAVRALALNPLGGNIGINLGAGVLPTSSLHVAGNARVTGAYYDSNNSPGTAGQVLSSTATGTDWVAAGNGTITGVTAGTGMTGGGTSGTVTLNVIGGTGITANANDIAIDSTVLTTTGSQTITGAKRFNGSILDKDGSSGTSGQVLASTGTGQVDWVSAGTGTITGDAREGRIAFGSATTDDITNDEDFTIVQTTNEKRIQIAGGVQVADMNALASASLAGSLRYRVAIQTSYVDMCMQTGPGIYSWVNIVQNSWTI